MTSIQFHNQIHFQDPSLSQRLDSEVAKKLNKTVEGPGSEIIVQNAKGKVLTFGIEDVIAHPEKLKGYKQGIISIQGADGKSIVIELSKLDRKELLTALKQYQGKVDLEQVKQLNHEALPIIQQILGKPEEIKPIQKLAVSEPLPPLTYPTTDTQAFIQRIEDDFAFIKKVGADPTDHAQILLKKDGFVDQVIGRINKDLEGLLDKQNQMIGLMQTAQQKGQKQITFEGKTYNFDQAKAQLETLDGQLKKLSEDKTQLFEKLKSWADKYSFSSEHLDGKSYSLSELWAAQLSRWGVGDTSGHGWVGTTGMAKDMVTLGIKLAPKVIRLLEILNKKLGIDLMPLLKKLPPDMQKKVTDMLAKLAGKSPEKAAEEMAKGLKSKLTLGNALAVYGTARYGMIAAGLWYSNETITLRDAKGNPILDAQGNPKTVDVELRASRTSSAFAALASGLNGLSVGFPVAGLFAIVAELGTEMMMARDKEELELIYNKTIGAQDGKQLREGLDTLRKLSSDGSLKDIHHVLGQGPNDQDLTGMVLNKIAKFALDGKISKAEANQAIAEILSGVDTRTHEDDDVVYGFMKQAMDGGYLDELIKMLPSETRLLLFKVLDEGITFESEGDMLDKLARAETDPTTKGKMIALLLDGATRSRFEDLAFEMLKNVRDQADQTKDFTDFRQLLNAIQLDGKSLLNQIGGELKDKQVGQIMAWMIQANMPQDQLNAFAKKFSDNWLNDDDITVAMLNELNDLKVQGEDLQKFFTQNTIKRLFSNLEKGWTTTTEYEKVSVLAKSADAKTKTAMIQQLMKGATFNAAEKTIAEILKQATAEEKKYIAANLNLYQLGQEIHSAQSAAEFMNELAKMDLPREELNKYLNKFFDGVVNAYFIYHLNTEDDDAAYTFIKNLDDKGLTLLNDDIRKKMFQSLDDGYTSKDEYDMMRKVMQGASTDLKAEMINYLMAQATDSSQEDVIYYILQDTPYENREFLNLVDKLDTSRLATEIEKDSDAATIGRWITKAYDKANIKPPEAKLDDFLIKLAEQHRHKAITDYINAEDMQANDKALFRGLKPETIQAMAHKFMDGDTNADEENAIYELVKNSSWKQFDAFMKADFRDRLQSELSSSQWKQVQQWYWDLPKHL